MMKQYYGDPGDAFNRYDADQAEAEKKLFKTSPKCQLCGEPILEDHCYCLTHSDDFEERFTSCVHLTCLRQLRFWHRPSDRFNELVKNYLEETAWSDAPFEEVE